MDGCEHINKGKIYVRMVINVVWGIHNESSLKNKIIFINLYYGVQITLLNRPVIFIFILF